MSFLEITEEWIKDKVKITKEKLDDIKSLSLPGTYDEKIYKIGPSLTHFTRLKELDLSRNVLESLEGMEHLRCLESLNLYYNNVGSLKELYRLRSNECLAQLDLRLNPVARNEADYRLCLIHMLPLLVRLDDRCVKDQERKAALMYFGSDQSREFSPNSNKPKEDNDRQLLLFPARKPHPRVEMVNRWTKGIVNEDLFDKSKNDNDNFHLNLNEVDTEDMENIIAPRFSDCRTAKEYSPKGSQSFTSKRLSVEREFSNGKSLSLRANKFRNNYSTVPVYVRQDEPSPVNEDQKKVNGDGLSLLTLDEQIVKSRDVNSCSSYPHLKSHSSNHLNDTEMDSILPREVTDKMCDLIDRYWNGSRSLHQNQTFLTAINHMLINHLSYPSESLEIKPEINRLRENIVKLEKENINLKTKLLEVKPHLKKTELENLEDIKRTNRYLKDEISELRHKLQASEKMSEVTDLLKQSHDSLITTNEQLRMQLSQQNKPFKLRGY